MRLRLVITNIALLAFEPLRKPEPWRRLPFAGSSFEDDLSRLAISHLDGIHDPRSRIRRNYKTVHQQEHRFRKVNVEQRFWCGKFEYLAVLVKPIESSLADLEQLRFKQVSFRRRW